MKVLNIKNILIKMAIAVGLGVGLCMFKPFFVSVFAVYTSIVVGVCWLIALGVKGVHKKINIRLGIFGDILIVIILTCTFQNLLHVPAMLLGRNYAIDQADKIIQYMEKEKKATGVYPSVNVNTIAKPGFTANGYFCYTKTDTLGYKGVTAENRKELESE